MRTSDVVGKKLLIFTKLFEVRMRFGANVRLLSYVWHAHILTYSPTQLYTFVLSFKRHASHAMAHKFSCKQAKQKKSDERVRSAVQISRLRSLVVTTQGVPLLSVACD